MNNKKVLVIIPVYNGNRYIPSLLASLEKAHQAWPNFSVLMIDDQSVDDSQVLIKEIKFDWLEAIINSEKKFFVGGCNFGLQRAINDGYDYAFLLNQDTEITNDALPKMVVAMDADRSIGALQPTILLHPQTDLLNSQGCAIHIFGLGYTLGHKTKHCPSDKIIPVAYPSGAAVMYRVEMLSSVGLLASKYEMYHEDLEIGWRTWLAGWRCVCVTGAIIYHKHEFSRSISRIYFMERNRWLFILSRYSVVLLLLLSPGLILFELVLLLLALKNSWLGEKIKSYKYFLQSSTWDFIKFERQQMKVWQKVDDRKLLWLLTPVVEYQDLGDNMIVDFGNKLIKLYWKVVSSIISL